MYQFIPQHSGDYLCKSSIEINKATDEDNNQTKMWLLNKYDIGVGVQNCIEVWLKPVASYLSWLERVIGSHWL